MTQRQTSPIKGLYAITPDEGDTAKLSIMVCQALQGGARVVQYRNKLANKALRLEQAMALRRLTLEFSVPLLINDEPMLAQLIDADGVHLGAEDDSIEVARDILGVGKLIGVSCYNCLDIARDAARRGADYVAFGSFFASAVKPGAVGASPDLLRVADQEISLPLVAIGGISASNGAELVEAGADALAVISALFGANDVRGAALEFAGLKYH
jgi:thiamine-phosphate pyrophosphorylase